MTGKTFFYILGTIILLVFGVFAFLPIIQEGVATNNTTWAGANYTAVNQAIRFTPLALIIGIIATPLACILIFLYGKRQGVF